MTSPVALGSSGAASHDLSAVAHWIGHFLAFLWTDVHYTFEAVIHHQSPDSGRAFVASVTAVVALVILWKMRRLFFRSS
jgi:hypothetical protein